MTEYYLDPWHCNGHIAFNLWIFYKQKCIIFKQKSFAFNFQLIYYSTVCWHFSILSLVKIGWIAWGCYAAERKQEDIKNVDHMMVNYDITAVREFMFLTWAQIRIERLFLQLVMEKLTSLDNFPPLNYHKTSNPLFLFLPLKFQKNFPPSWFTSLYKGEERLYEYYNKFGIYEAIPCTLLRTMRKQLQ